MQSPKPVGLRFLLIDDEGDGASRLFDEVDDLCVGIEYLSIVEDAFHWDFLTKPQNKTPDNPSRSSGIYEIFAERLFLYHFLTINDIYTLVLGFCFKLSTIQIIPDIIFDFILQNGRYTSRYWITFC